MNINKVNNLKSNNIAISYQRSYRGDRRLWQIDFCKQVSFEFFPEGGNRCCTAYIVRKVTPNLRASKAKLWPKCLTDL